MTNTCPETPTLHSLLLGQHLGPEGERWLGHLVQCRACLTAAASLAALDPLARAAREAADGPPTLLIPPDELPVVQSLIERTRSLCRDTVSGPADSGTVRPEAMTFLEPPRQAGELGRLARYRVQRLLGSGGMGLVFLAEDESLRRPVALKVLHPRLAQKPEARARFLREARAMAAITHDHIVSVYHVDEAGDTPFLAMPVLAGLPLSAWLKQNPPPPLARVLRWGREIASGLAAAHERGLVHRDVKPANLWIEGEPGASATGGKIKILDFGLAHCDREDVHLTADGVIVGTPAYMAPEQARGAAPDPRADLFSLGCVLYELCTGVTPFRGDSVMEVLSSLANDEPVPVRARNPAVPAALATLVMQLLAKRPADRPASARQVADRLAAIEAGRPDGRRRWARPLAAAALLLAVVGVAGGVWWSRRGSDVPPPPQDRTDVRPAPPSPPPDPEPPRNPERLVGHTEAVTALRFVSGGRTLASASADGTVRLWKLPAGTQTTLTTFPASCTALALSADGRTLASGCRDGSVRLDDLTTGQVLLTFNEPDRVGGLAFGRNNTMYVGTDRGVISWGLPATRRDPIVVTALNHVVCFVAMTPAGDQLVAGTGRGFVYFDRVFKGQGLQIVDAHTGPVRAGAVSPDGKELATVGGPPDERVRFWDLGWGQETFPRQRSVTLHPGGATAVAWSPDGRVVASGGVDGVVRLWDPKTGTVRAEWRQHQPTDGAGVICLAFSPDGRLLASGGADKVIRLQDVSAFSGPPDR
jgi:serine/threonine protein kinase